MPQAGTDLNNIFMNQASVDRVAEWTGLPPHKVAKTMALLDEGATIPFIARYRKEATGSLDEVQIANVQQAAKRLHDLLKRKESILASIEEQGKLSSELRRQIEQCFDPTELEDLYLPYKRKRKTRASAAREKGLEPLANWLWNQHTGSVEAQAKRYLSEQVANIEEALQGARDILAEQLNEDQTLRQITRKAYERGAVISARVARGKDEEGAKYRDYFDYSEPLNKCPSHRLLAIRRGEEEGFLRVGIAPEKEFLLERLERQVLHNRSEAAEQVQLALHDAYDRLLQPSIETEFRQSSKEKADLEAIEVFTKNLRQLLLSAPLGQRTTLGIDPGFRSGCKVVILDSNGELLEHGTIYPHPPQNKTTEALDWLQKRIEHYQVEAIAVGNGTAGRETLSALEPLRANTGVNVFLVNENGASIYSASELAREEFPELDLTVRGAISIGRRLMDPLAELVKIDAKSIGVGQYQHDVNQSLLRESLDRVVESCVNAVGINVNTASKHLLTYVSGLGPVLAQNLVNYRRENGPFTSRKALKSIPRMGDKAFEQSAGFLRVRNGAHPLDNTAVHPERYPLVEQMAAELRCQVQDLIQSDELRSKIDLKRYVDEQVGLPTLQDILAELAKPGLDPRGEAKPFEFARGIHSIDDLRPDMVLPGIVTNITNFGAFVDIGVKQDGLVHVSQLANRFVKNPAEVVKLSQEVQVRVIEIDLARKRIMLSMKK